jgi:Ni/Co efflux regulator RcnB
MTNNDNILDELFRSKLDDFEQDPPSYVWMKIQEKQKAGKRKRMLHAVRMGGIAAAVFLAFLLGWLLQEGRHQLTEKPVVAEQEQQKDQMPEQEQSEKREPAQSAVQGEKMATVDHRQDVQPKQDVQSSPKKRSSGESFNLLTMADGKIETPEFVNKLESKWPGSRKEEPVLTETDKIIIEMNKQFYTRKEDVKNDKSWSVGALVSPAYSVNRSSHDDIYASNMSRPGEKRHISLGGGISVEYQTGKRWSIQSGLHYSRLSQSTGTSVSRQDLAANDGLNFTYFNNKVQRESTTGQLLMNGSAGVIGIENLPPSVRVSGSMESTAGDAELLLTSDDFEQRFEYIEVPVFVRYKLVDKIWNMDMLGGFSANMLVGNEAYLKNGSTDSYIGKTKDMSRLNYSASFGFGMGYQLTNKIELRVEPQLKYYLRSLNSNPDVNFKPYSIGIYTGISYRF